MAFRRSPPAGTVTGFMSAELSIDAMSSSVRTNGEASGTGKPADIGCMASAAALMLRAPSSNEATVPDVPARERAVPTARVKSGAWALVAVRAVARKSSWRELDIIIALLGAVSARLLKGGRKMIDDRGAHGGAANVNNMPLQRT